MAKKVFIRTYGCQMNEYDSARMLDALREGQAMESTDRPEDADLILLNTCSIREKAQEKVFSELGRYRSLKADKPDLLIGVGGCVASQEGHAIADRAPFVDLVFGHQTLHRLPEMIDLERQTFNKQLDGLRDLSNIKLTAELAKRVLEVTFKDKLTTPIRDKDSKEMRERTLVDLPEYSLIREHCYGSTGLGMDMQGVHGTVYGLFNGITQCMTHDGGKSTDNTERNRVRLESLWGGRASKRIEAAREACLALV